MGGTYCWSRSRAACSRMPKAAGDTHYELASLARCLAHLQVSAGRTGDAFAGLARVHLRWDRRRGRRWARAGDGHIRTLRPDLGRLLAIPTEGEEVVPGGEVGGDLHCVYDVEVEARGPILVLLCGARFFPSPEKSKHMECPYPYKPGIGGSNIGGNLQFPRPPTPPEGSPHAGIGFFVHSEPCGAVPADTRVAVKAVRLDLSSLH